jgi:uncharacterized protein (TIGR02594 family)
MTLFELGQRFIGHLQEKPGIEDHPYIRFAHSLTTLGESHDEIPWCSSWLNSLCFLLDLPRSHSAAARSWMPIGNSIGTLFEAQVGNDIVVLNRGGSPDPTVSGPGHVGIFAGLQGSTHVLLLGGNQGNAVNVRAFPVESVLGIRRLADAAQVPHG